MKNRLVWGGFFSLPTGVMPTGVLPQAALRLPRVSQVSSLWDGSLLGLASNFLEIHESFMEIRVKKKTNFVALNLESKILNLQI